MQAGLEDLKNELSKISGILRVFSDGLRKNLGEERCFSYMPFIELEERTIKAKDHTSSRRHLEYEIVGRLLCLKKRDNLDEWAKALQQKLNSLSLYHASFELNRFYHPRIEAVEFKLSYFRYSEK